ncbi:hypothetical protein BGX28_004272 [Mortierella sp. GBA30]|nr:hypothetical protein BGX28_004272 [Mortierella sp. GBA30]
MLQNHYLQNQQQQYLKQTKQYGTVHQQQHQHRNSLQRPTVSQMQSLRRDLRPAPLIETRSLDSSRPLPTPPPTKSVRWASHNEVLEIENIDELIQLGYYRDYDHGLEWGYCSESQDESSSDDDYEEDDEDNLSESENEYTSMFNSHKPQCQHRSFECESECNSITDSTFDDEDTESESQAAEDELIQRMSGEAFMLSLASSSSSSPTSLASNPAPNGLTSTNANLDFRLFPRIVSKIEPNVPRFTAAPFRTIKHTSDKTFPQQQPIGSSTTETGSRQDPS